MSDRRDEESPRSHRPRRARRAAQAAGAAGVAFGVRRLFRRRRVADPGGTPEPHGPSVPITEHPGATAAMSRHRDVPGERRASRRIALLLLLSTASGIGLLILYAAGGQTQLEGALIALTLGAMGFALILWGKHLFSHEIVTEPREPHESEAGALRAAQDLIEQTESDVTRRRFLTRMLLAAAGAFGLALVFPIRSLGPSPGRTLFITTWRRGLRLLDEAGEPVRADTLPVDGVVTVFPEGHVGDATAQAILVRVEEDRLRLPSGRERWAPDGNVCYSKLCTHAGCPVGLYVATYHQLQCPCHQSAFDVLDGASVVFGPAARPLPQLPVETDGDGFLVAGGDFSAPVGPGFWNRGDGP